MDFLRDDTVEPTLQQGPETASDFRSASAWSVPWADLMMVMFVLFVVLFVYASQKRDTALLFANPQQGAVQAEPSPMQTLMLRLSAMDTPAAGNAQKVYEQARRLLYTANGGGVAVTMEPDGGVRVNLGGEVVFKENSAAIGPAGLAYLDETAKLLQSSPRRVHIVGYADSAERGGQPAAQLELSMERAAAAARRLMGRHQIESHRFAVSGRGAAGLLAPATTPENRRKNRRIEIVILPDAAPDKPGGNS
jgi:chemotaxis protein MotB